MGATVKLKYKGKEITLDTESGIDYFPMEEGKTFGN